MCADIYVFHVINASGVYINSNTRHLGSVPDYSPGTQFLHERGKRLLVGPPFPTSVATNIRDKGGDVMPTVDVSHIFSSNLGQPTSPGRDQVASQW